MRMRVGNLYYFLISQHLWRECTRNLRGDFCAYLRMDMHLEAFFFRQLIFISILFLGAGNISAQDITKPFSVLAFYTGKNDAAHISFVDEANSWFTARGAEHGFRYLATNDWSRMRTDTLQKYQVVIFLDSRPDSLPYRKSFEHYMANGGAWLGFHFAAFAMNGSAYPQNWPWYHEEFLGSGQYVSNTWRPTSAVLRVDGKGLRMMKGIPDTFKSAPNEWYRWEFNVKENPDIRVLLSIDSTSFPLGTGPKPHEIWHSGNYPVAWTNTSYRMVYINMGHNDMDYEGGKNKTLSSTFSSKDQNQFILNMLLWLGKRPQ